MSDISKAAPGAEGLAILEAALAQFDAKEIRGPILVPAWLVGGKPAEIYYRRINVAELSYYKPRYETRPRNRDDHEHGIAAYALLIIEKALNEKGEKLFTVGARGQLLGAVDPHIVTGIATAMINDDPNLALLFMPSEDGDSAATMAALAGALAGRQVEPETAAASMAEREDPEAPDPKALDPAGN